MRLGIDFGTTRTVVAACDRGNYPVISFNAGGEAQEFFPSLIAEKAGQLCFGFDAVAKRGQAGWHICPSFKRWLSAPDATLHRRVQVGSLEMDLISVVSRYLEALKQALLTSSNLPLAEASPALDATIATPANAFSTQRLVTLEAFRNAGFNVVSMLNEPSAAGVEYAHRYRNTLNSRREKVVVYDLGGGTFDVSVVDMQGRAHDVVASRGLGRLGGDDFDDVLVALALTQAGQTLSAPQPALTPERLGQRAMVELAQHCRELKEAINPNTRKIHVELGRVLTPGERKRLGIAEGYVAVVTVDAFEAACAPLLDRTLELVRDTLGVSGVPSDSEAAADAADSDGPDADLTRDIAGLYVVGGASALPAVARGLRALYGRRVKRSPYPSGAIAIGLAIAADEQASYSLGQRFHHNLGVFREAQSGEEIGFDRIIGPDTLVPAPGGEPVCLSRTYRAKHNVGHFRFIECGWLDDSGHPSGDIKPFADVRFPFDPALRAHDDLSHVPVARTGSDGPEIEERYSISEYGAVELTILDRTSGYERNYRIAG